MDALSLSYIIGIENTGFHEGRDSHGSHCRIQPGASRLSLSFRRRARAAPREIHRLRGCAFSGQYRRRGMLYFFLDAFHLVHMDWSFFDAVVVALFGVPGTIFLAILALF